MAQAISATEYLAQSAKFISARFNMPHSQDATIDAALLAAHKLGIQKDEDAVAYAWRVVLHQSAFTQHAALAEIIALTHSSGLPLDAVLDERLPLAPTKLAQQHTA